MNYVKIISGLKRRWKKIMGTIVGITAVLGGLWYAIFGLKPYQVSEQAIVEKYSYQQTPINMVVNKESEPEILNSHTFTYTSFDGAKVNGRIAYPEGASKANSKLPLLIGVHAMGRSDNRWFMESFKERPTLEQTDEITKQALANGYAVVAIDSRNHGLRKDLTHTIRDVMQNLHLWGEREPYRANDH